MPDPVTIRERDHWPTTEWRVADPEANGMDGAHLVRATDRLNELLPGLRGVIMVRHGRIVLEHYHEGCGVDSVFAVYSATKSIVSLLAGVAVRDGLLPSLDERIGAFFPGVAASAVTIRQLLSMTAGWPYRDTLTSTLPAAELAAQPLVGRPGERFEYDNGATQVLLGILAAVLGQHPLDYARQQLFGPLGVWARGERWFEVPGTEHPQGSWPGGGWPWRCAVDGLPAGAFGLHLSMRDMARLGLLCASSGTWENRQIVPADYLRATTQPLVAGASPMWMPYGCHWWVPTWHRGWAMHAAGHGGQTIYANVDHDVVIAIACRMAPGEAVPNSSGLLNRLLAAIRDWS